MHLLFESWNSLVKLESWTPMAKQSITIWIYNLLQPLPPFGPLLNALVYHLKQDVAMSMFKP
jgi:hypothetical protein